MRWFISDLHFGHQNIIRYQANTRPFKSVTEMDEHMIKTWNKNIKPEDTVFVIGDFCFHRKFEKLKEITGRLNGNKILIRGNHDLASTRELLDAGFKDVLNEFYITLSNGELTLLKHYPYDSPWYVRWFNRLSGRLGPWKKYYLYYPVNKGHWLIHGHHHGAPIVKDKQINVNVDSHNFKPMSEGDVIRLMREHKPERYKILKFIKKKIIGKIQRWKASLL